MFWNKKIIEVFKTDTSQLDNIKRQVEEINRIYSNPENAHSDIEIDRFQDSVSLNIVTSYYNKTKMLAQFKIDNRDLRAIVEGNGEYWGQWQRNYEECQQRLANSELHLKLEKEMYQKIYKRNRDLESEVYLLKREIEILKGEVK
jgi:hypothetical protein